VATEITAASKEDPGKGPTEIIESKIRDLPQQVVAKLPQRAALKRRINRVRQANFPQNPKTLEELGELPPEFRRTMKKDSFLLYDSYEDDPEEPRIIVFSTRENLRKLGKSKTWYSDGTFKVCPSSFAQIFTIHGLVKKIAFPFVYALLPNKEQASYQRVFQVLKDASANFNTPLPEPETLISDFELAIINAGIAEYPHATVRLCFFHFGQSAYR